MKTCKICTGVYRGVDCPVCNLRASKPKMHYVDPYTPGEIKAMINATGNRWPTKDECDRNNPFFYDIETLTIAQIKEKYGYIVSDEQLKILSDGLNNKQ